MDHQLPHGQQAGQKPDLSKAPFIIDDNKKFEVLLDGLKDSYKELADTGLKISAATLVVLGWFAAQKDPLPFLCAGWIPVVIACALNLVGLCVVVFMFHDICKRAEISSEHLRARNVDPCLFDRYLITPRMFWVGSVGVSLTFLGMLAAIAYKYLWVANLTCK